MLPEQVDSPLITLLKIALILVLLWSHWKMVLDVWNNDKEGRWGWIMFIVPIIGSTYYWYSVKRPRDKINKKFSSK